MLFRKARENIMEDIIDRIELAGLSEEDFYRVVDMIRAPEMFQEELEEHIYDMLERLPLAPELIKETVDHLTAHPDAAEEIFAELRAIQDEWEGVFLNRVDFSWEKSTYRNSAIPILPEDAGWIPNVRSYTAYSLADIKDTVEAGKLRIQAQFYTSWDLKQIQVRTRNVDLYFRDALTGKIQKSHIEQNVLGTVKPTTIYLDENGNSVFRGKYSSIPLKLEGVSMLDLGVGVYDIDWQWEFRARDEEASTEKETVWEEEWQAFETTRHRVFVVLSTPKFPWTPYRHPDFESGSPYASPLHADALEHACYMAAGATNAQEAAEKITKSLFDADVFVYHPNPTYYQAVKGDEVTYQFQQTQQDVKDGESSVRIHNFYIRKVFERLNGGLGLGKKVNCMDCALIVSSFANIIGCELKVGKLQASENMDSTDPNLVIDNRFEINRIRAIGHKDADETMPGLSTDGKHYFSFHAVAWQMATDEGGKVIPDFDNEEIRVFDACLQFEVGQDEEGKFMYAAGIPLGGMDEEGKYRTLLATNNEEGRPRCIPQEVTLVNVQLR